MVLAISDRFYEPYSFAIDFGRSSKQEVHYIRGIIAEKGLTSTDSNVKSALFFIKKLAPIVQDINDIEIKQIKTIIIKERITGGIVPPDISIAYHLLTHLMDIVVYGLASKELIQIARSDKISKLASKAVSRLKRSKKVKSLIKKQLQKIKKWKKKKNTRDIKKSNKTTKKKKTVKRKR